MRTAGGLTLVEHGEAQRYACARRDSRQFSEPIQRLLVACKKPTMHESAVARSGATPGPRRRS